MKMTEREMLQYKAKLCVLEGNRKLKVGSYLNAQIFLESAVEHIKKLIEMDEREEKINEQDCIDHKDGRW